MYKIIANVDALKHFQEKTRHTLSLWENTHAVAGIKEIVEQTDIYYGADRDIFADMGGYLIIFYGDSTEIEKEYHGFLKHYYIEKDLYEFENTYQNGPEKVVIRLYICSNDYALAVVTVQ